MSMLQVPRSQSPRSQRSARGQGRSRADSKTKEDVRDPWLDNIHFTQVHDEPETAMKLYENQRLVGEHDQFIEYIHHVESRYPLSLILILALLAPSQPPPFFVISDFILTDLSFCLHRFEATEAAEPD